MIGEYPHWQPEPAQKVHEGKALNIQLHDEQGRPLVVEIVDPETGELVDPVTLLKGLFGKPKNTAAPSRLTGFETE